MDKKPTFKKTSSLLYKNTSPKTVDYSNYIKPRNKEDEKFYSERKTIVKLEFENILLPYLKFLTKAFPKKSIKCLDVGCGDGVVLEALNSLNEKKRLNIELFGLDLDKEAMKSIKFKAKLTVASATKMPYSKNFFDFIICSQTLEHFHENDLKKTLSEIYRVLKPGGFFYAETPNPESLLAIVMGKKWWMYLDEHLILIPPLYAKKILSKLGFVNIIVKTRMEIDRQINEVMEIIIRLKLPPLVLIPLRIKAYFIKKFCYIFNKGAVLIIVAQK